MINSLPTLLANLKNSKGIWQTAYSIAGNIFATGISALALILITRLLGPDQFGVFSVGFALSLILVKINDLGLNTAVIKFASINKKPSYNNAIYSLVLKYKLIISLFISIVGIITILLLSRYNTSLNKQILFIACTLGLSSAYYEQLLSFFQSQHLFKKVIITNITQSSIKLGAVLFFSALSIKNVYIIFSLYVMAPLFSATLLVKQLPHWFRISLQLQDAKLYSNLLSVVKHSSVSLISSGIIENLDILFINYYLTDYDTGLYSGVMRIAQLFSLGAYYLGDVLNARVALYIDKVNIDGYMPKALGIVFLSILGFLVTIPFSGLFINWTIGSEYLGGRSTLLILLAASFLKIASIPFIATYYAYSKYWVFSLTGIIQLVVLIVGSIIVIPVYGLYGAAVVRLATQALLFLVSLGISRYLYINHHGKFSTKN